MSEVEEPVICTACSFGPCAKTYLGSKGCKENQLLSAKNAEPAAEPPAPEEEV